MILFSNVVFNHIYLRSSLNCMKLNKVRNVFIDERSMIRGKFNSR